MPVALPIAICGAAGRMGQAILELASLDPSILIVAAIVRPGSALLGVRVGQTFGIVDENLQYAIELRTCDSPAVLLDFSSSEGFDSALTAAIARRCALVSGTTSLSRSQLAAMRTAAEHIPVLWSANFSIGVAVLDRIVREAARALPDWDCEIAEAHHRHKKDAPSGTALALGRAVADARGVDFKRVAQRERVARIAARDASTIGFSSVRAGDIVGEHKVLFAGAGERVELTHRATDRTIFARGALRAAMWIAGQPPGLYTLADVIGRASA